jgi:RsiW-degrading membrane proteinase PrsW (M82 family)
MTPVQTAIAVLVAVGIPVFFLVIIYALDLYASRTFSLVLICFGWGGIGGLGLAYAFNTYAAVPLIHRLHLDYIWLYVVFAPMAEEILKSLSLFYVSRRPEFTYFVDGAIYGFAAGIGFSITENFLYMTLYPQQGAGLYLVRALSTCLMHGTAAALVGVAVGRSRFQKRSGRNAALVGGWIAAITLHALFNSVSKAGFVSDNLVLPLVVGIGLAGVGLIASFISAGLREQRQWLAETLDRQMGVTGAEMRAAQAYATIDEVLEPIEQQFPRQVEQIETLLLRQAQMGIKRKVQQELDDPKVKERLGAEIEQLQTEVEQLQRDIGPYVMVFVRTVFPEGISDIWAQVVERMTTHDAPVDDSSRAKMLAASDKPAEAKQAPRSIFDVAREREE